MKETDIRRIFAKVQSPSPGKPRRSLTRKERDEVQKKTAGTCHFCGAQLNGSWQADHVIAHLFGGECTVENCLPICVECNRLRWSYPPEVLRLMLRFGRYAKQEIRHWTKLGDQLVRLATRKSRGAQ